jgi:hypothetical protein
MSYGYSARLIEINKRADDTRVGVALGRVCIALDIPVVTIAKDAGVCKQTVYNWFMGLYEPHPKCKDAVVDLIRTLNKQ